VSSVPSSSRMDEIRLFTAKPWKMGRTGGGRRGKEEPKWKMGRTEGGDITHLCIMHGAHTSNIIIQQDN